MYYEQESGIIILCLMLYYMIKNRLIFNKREKIFVVFIIVSILSIFINICAMYCIIENNSIILQGFLCSLYLLGLLITLYLSSLYVLYDISDYDKVRQIYKINKIIVILAAVVIIACPVSISYLNKDINVISASGSVINTFSIYIFLEALLLLHEYGQFRYKRKMRTTILCIIAWFLLLIYQSFSNNLLSHADIISIGVLVLFIGIANPIGRLDVETDAFNMYAFVDYIKGIKKQNTDYNVLVIQLLNDNYSNDAMNELMNTFINKEEFKVFKNIDYELYLVMNNNLDKKYLEILIRDITNIVKKNNSACRFISIDNLGKIDPINCIEYIDALKIDEIGNLFDITYINKENFKRLSNIRHTKNIIIKAIRDDRVDIFIQPIYSTKDNKFCSGEVLCRIINEDGEIIPPSKFIPVAEESGLILELEDIIFEKACKFIREHDLDSLGLNYLEINLSVIKGESKELKEKYSNILNKYKINPNMINLEITESASLNTTDALVNNIYKFIDLGFNFSLDDFGSGESNLNYIIDIPVKLVKFDRDMTNRYFMDERAKVVMKSTIDMIHNLGLKVVIEGVETEEQLKSMININADYIQGYYFSKPLPKLKFIEFLEGELHNEQHNKE